MMWLSISILRRFRGWSRRIDMRQRLWSPRGDKKKTGANISFREKVKRRLSAVETSSFHGASSGMWVMLE